MSWVTDLWKLLETVATLTKEVERSNSEIKELRRDVNSLTLAVSELRNELTHEKETTKLILENFEKEGKRLKESLDSKFDVLVSRLDLKIAAFENRMALNAADEKMPRALRMA